MSRTEVGGFGYSIAGSFHNSFTACYYSSLSSPLLSLTPFREIRKFNIQIQVSQKNIIKNITLESHQNQKPSRNLKIISDLVAAAVGKLILLCLGSVPPNSHGEREKELRA